MKSLEEKRSWSAPGPDLGGRGPRWASRQSAQAGPAVVPRPGGAAAGGPGGVPRANAARLQRRCAGAPWCPWLVSASPLRLPRYGPFGGRLSASESARAEVRQQDYGSEASGATSALPTAASFAQLGLPAEILRALDEHGVTVPSPSRRRRCRTRSRDGTSWAGAAQDPARRSPLAWGCSPGRPGSARSPKSRWCSFWCPPGSWRSRSEALTPYAEALRLRLAIVVGGVSIGRQAAVLRDGAEIVVATPGRLHDLIERKGCRLGRMRITGSGRGRPDV